MADILALFRYLADYAIVLKTSVRVKHVFWEHLLYRAYVNIIFYGERVYGA